MSSFLAALVELSEQKEELGRLRDWMYNPPPKPLTVRARVDDKDPVESLVDTGCQLNLISAALVKEWDLKTEPLPEIAAWAPNNTEIPLYGIVTIRLIVTDSRGRERPKLVEFVVTELRKY